MKQSTLNMIFTIIFILLHLNIFGQVTYYPLLIINDNFQNINFKAKEEYCFYNAKPKDLIENPEFKASIIKRYKIKSINHKNLESSIIELFDNNGHLICQKEFVNQSLFNSITMVNRYNKSSFLTRSRPDKNPKRIKNYYNYDRSGNLIKYIELHKRGIFKRRLIEEQNYTFDTLGNLTYIQGIKEFYYNKIGALVLEKEININGESFSKVNLSEGCKANYANRQFKEYFYDSFGNLELIKINHFDSINFENFKIAFEYDELMRLITITKYFGNGEKWEVNQLEYSNSLLIANCLTCYNGTSDDYYTITTKYSYENGLICKTEEFYSNEKTKNYKREEIQYEYTFY